MGVSLIVISLLVLNARGIAGVCSFPSTMSASWWQKYDGTDEVIQRFDSTASKIYIESKQGSTVTKTESYDCNSIHDTNLGWLFIRQKAGSAPECVSAFITPTTKNTYVQQVAPIPAAAVSSVSAKDCVVYMSNASAHEFFVKYPFNFATSTCSMNEGTYNIIYQENSADGKKCENIGSSTATVTKTSIQLKTCSNVDTYTQPLFTSLSCVDHLAPHSLKYEDKKGTVVILARGGLKRQFYCVKVWTNPANRKLYMSLLINTGEGVVCNSDQDYKSFGDIAGTKYVAFEMTLNHCISNPCKNGANCTSSWSDYQCSCLPGYTGVNCETNFNECASMPCQNGATCQDLVNGYQCICPPDFTGIQCEQELCSYPSVWNTTGPFFQEYDLAKVNLMKFSKIAVLLETASSPSELLCIKNTTVGMDTYSVAEFEKSVFGTTIKRHFCYEHRLIAPFMLYRDTSNGINKTSDCSAELGPRLATIIMIKHPFDFSGGVLPFPAAEYQLTYSDKTTDSACAGVSTSTATSSTRGFSINSCFTGTASYEQPLSGSFEVVGRIDAAALDTTVGFSDALILARKDSAGAYRFYCARWKVVGITVMLSVDVTDKDVLRCVANVPHDRAGAIQGAVNQTSVAFNLTSMECDKTPCKNGGTCEQGLAMYNCTCPPGFDGKHCENNIDECASSPCQNGGTCNDMINMYNCTCPQNFVGTHCETPDHCWNDPCQQGGTCAPNADNTDYVCTCPPGYDGKNCQNDINECASNPCQNTGTCKDLINGYNCTCPAGVGGANCENDIDECLSGPCQNGGTCHDRYNGYLCTCPTKYIGTHCESINECHSNPCQNGGVCEDDLFFYKCNCTKGFSGVNCEINDNNCANNPCQNGGRCEDGLDAYKCFCLAGYIGTNCQIDIDECASNPCRRGTCEDLIGSFRCTCPSGYSGIFCDLRAPQKLEGDLITIIILSIFAVVTVAVIIIALITLYYRRRRRRAKDRFFANGEQLVSQQGSVKSSVRSWAPDYRSKNSFPE